MAARKTATESFSNKPLSVKASSSRSVVTNHPGHRVRPRGRTESYSCQCRPTRILDRRGLRSGANPMKSIRGNQIAQTLHLAKWTIEALGSNDGRAKHVLHFNAQPMMPAGQESFRLSANRDIWESLHDSLVCFSQLPSLPPKLLSCVPPHYSHRSDLLKRLISGPAWTEILCCASPTTLTASSTTREPAGMDLPEPPGNRHEEVPA